MHLFLISCITTSVSGGEGDKLLRQSVFFRRSLSIPAMSRPAFSATRSTPHRLVCTDNRCCYLSRGTALIYRSRRSQHPARISPAGRRTAGAAIRCGNLARIASDQNWRRPGAQRAILTSFSFFIAPTTTTPVVFAAPRCDAGETGARTGRDAIGARAEHVGAAAYRADIRCAVLRGEK